MTNTSLGDVFSIAYAGNTATFELLDKNSLEPKDGTFSVFVDTDNISRERIATNLRDEIAGRFSGQTPALELKSASYYKAMTDAESITVNGSTAYVADGAAGLRVLDVNDPVAVTELGAFDTIDAQSVTIDGTTAYVADGAAGVRVLDVSDPAAITELGAFDTTDAQSVTLDGTTVYVSDGAGGVRVLDVSDPVAVTELGVFDTTDAQSVTLDGTTAYVADGADGVRVLDVSNPAAITQLGIFETTDAQSVILDGTTAYVADGVEGLLVLNVSNPASMSLIKAFDIGSASDVILHNGSLFACIGTDLVSVDLSQDPATVLASYEAQSVDVQGQGSSFVGSANDEVNVSAGPLSGDTVTLTLGDESIVFELVVEGTAPAADRVGVELLPFESLSSDAAKAAAAHALMQSMNQEFKLRQWGVSASILDPLNDPTKITLEETAITAGRSLATDRGEAIALFNHDGALIELYYIGKLDYNRDNNSPTLGGDAVNFDAVSFITTDDGISIDLHNNRFVYGEPKTADLATADIEIKPLNDVPVVNADGQADLVQMEHDTLDPVVSSLQPTGWESYFSDLGLEVPVPTEDETLVIPSNFLILNDERARDTAQDETIAALETDNNDASIRVFDATPQWNTVQYGGSVTVDAVTGDVTLVPPEDWYGDITFTYTIVDEGINEDLDGNRVVTPLVSLFSEAGTVTVSLQPVNDIPVAQDREMRFIESRENVADEFEFTAADLIAPVILNPGTGPGVVGPDPLVPNTPHARTADVNLDPPFNESEQQLRVVEFSNGMGITVSVDDLPDGKNGELTLNSNTGGIYLLRFTDGAFTSGEFVPTPNYNEREPFAITDSFTYRIMDDGQANASELTGQGYPDFDQEDQISDVSEPGTVTIAVTETNDAPEFDIPNLILDILERDDELGTTVAGFATDILPGPPTAIDELTHQNVSFTVVVDATEPSDVIESATLTPTGDLTVITYPDAVGQVRMIVTATDAPNDPNDVDTFVPRTTVETITINVRPVNDAPRLKDVLPESGENPASMGPHGLDEAWSVSSDPQSLGEITYTLREDNTQTGGIPQGYDIRVFGATGSGYQQLGLLDVFTVGPDNEATDVLPGVSVTSLTGSGLSIEQQDGYAVIEIEDAGDVVGNAFNLSYNDTNRTFSFYNSDFAEPSNGFINIGVDITADTPETVANAVKQSVVAEFESVFPVMSLEVEGNKLTAGPAFNTASLQTIRLAPDGFGVVSESNPGIIKTDRGGTLEANFDDSSDPTLITSLTYTPLKDFNYEIYGYDSFSYDVIDDSPYGETYDLDSGELVPDRRVTTNRVLLKLNPVNDRPEFQVQDVVLEDEVHKVTLALPEDYGYFSDTDFASGVVGGPVSTAFDELSQNVQFEVEMGSWDPDIPAFPPEIYPENSVASDFFVELPSISQSGSLSFEAKPDVFGEFIFKVQLVDDGDSSIDRGDLNTSKSVFMIINILGVNDPPIEDPSVDLDQATLEDVPFEIDGDELLSAFTVGPPNEELEQELSFAPEEFPKQSEQGGLLEYLRDADGNIDGLSYTPPRDFNGQDVFSYTVLDDGESGTLDGNASPDSRLSVKNVTVTIAAVNDIPRFSGAENQVHDEVHNESERDKLIENWATNVLAGPITATDEIEQQVLTFQFEPFNLNNEPADDIFSVPPSATIDPVTASANLSYQLKENAFGQASFYVTLQDDGTTNTENGDESISNPPRIFTVVVNDVNNPPEFQLDPDLPRNSEDKAIISVSEDSGLLTFQAIEESSISAGPDNEMQTVDFEVIPQNVDESFFDVQPTVSDSGVLSFRTAQNENTGDLVDGVVLKVVAIDTGGASSEPEEILLVVNPVNDPPVAVSDPPEPGDSNLDEYSEDLIWVIPEALLLQNDSDVDNTNLQAQPTSNFSDRGAQLTYSPEDAEVRYDPRQSSQLQALNEGDSVIDSFEYRAFDGELYSGITTVTFKVFGVNDAPIVAPDVAEINANNRAVIDVLQNDRDIDGSIDVQSIQIERGAAYGTVIVDTEGIVRYRSFGPLSSNDSFFYSVADTDNARSETVQVTILGNLPPIADDDQAVTTESTPVMIPVLVGDTDPDGSIDLQSVSIASAPIHGTAAVQADGQVLYTPNDGFIGQDSFQYTVLDDDGRESEAANVLVQVNAKSSPMQNSSNRFDVNADGVVTPVDSLRVLNELALNDGNTIPVPEDPVVPDYFDVNGDERISILDAKSVLDELSRQNAGLGEGEEANELVPLTQWYSNANVIDISAGLVQPEDLAPAMKIALPNCVPMVKEDVIDLLAADQDGDSEEDEFELVDEAFADIF